MANMGHTWWGSVPLDTIDGITEKVPIGSIIVHDPSPTDGPGTVCACRVKNESGFHRFVVVQVQRSDREMYTAAHLDHQSIVDALKYIKCSVPNGHFLQRLSYEQIPRGWFPGSFDTLVQSVNDLKRKLYKDNTFWGAVSHESYKVLMEHMKKQPEVSGRTYGIIVRYTWHAPEGHLFIVLRHEKTCVCVTFAPRGFIIRWRRCYKCSKNADAVMDFITRDLGTTLLPVDETVLELTRW